MSTHCLDSRMCLPYNGYKVMDMLDAKDLQALSQLMDEKLDKQKQDILGEVKTLISEEITASEARMTEKIEASEERMTGKIEASEERMKAHTDRSVEDAEQRMKAWMEACFTPRFDLLVENQQIIMEKMATKEDLRKHREEIDAELFLLKTAVKRNAQEIEKLKKAL